MTTVTAAAAPDAAWSVEGQWVDACNCAIPCPCWDGKAPSMGHCSEFYFFHVTKGHYGNTPLDGLDLVHVSQTAHGKTMDQSIADKDIAIANLYVPSSVSDETAATLDKVFSRFAFALDGSTRKHAVKKAAIQAALAVDKLDVSIPGVLDAHIQLKKDAAGQPVPFPTDTSTTGFLGKGTQGVSLAFDFHDDGLEWKHRDGNATWAPFSYSSDKGPLPWEPGYTPPGAAASAPSTSPSGESGKDAYADVHGLKMHYLRRGSGPTLVLLHPAAMGAETSWAAAIPFFAQSYDVIAPDQMGHGRTRDDVTRAFDYHAMAEDTVELLHQLGITNATLVGWSDGGILALDIAMHHPALAKKIVASSPNITPDGMKPFLLKHLKSAKANEWPQEMRDGYAHLSPDGADHWPVFADRLRKMLVTQPSWTSKDVAKIATPTLIIGADQDYIRTEHLVAIAEAIPGAELAILPHATHNVVTEDAARWNAVVRAFLDEKAKP